MSARRRRAPSWRCAVRGPPAHARPFLGVGNPTFQGGGANQALALNALAAACQEGGPADPALLRALQPLPETAAEVAGAWAAT